MQVSLNDLPTWSPWPARLLQLEPWAVPDRNVSKVDNEYDKGKYLQCKRYFEEKNGELDAEALHFYEMGIDPNTEMCISVADHLETRSFGAINSQFDTLLGTRLREITKGASVIIELGCGYGYNLWMLHKVTPEKRYIGGEYSANAVELGNKLYANTPNLRLVQFNYYDVDYDAVLGGLEGESVVVITVHSVEQIPQAGNIVEVLSHYGDRIQQVVHFEPVYEFCDSTLLGLIRKQYTIANDYNRDLFTCIQENPAATLLNVEKDVYGMNPLNPTSLIQWKPTA